MKKLFILAAAAVVALAACTKTEVVNNTPDQAIAFQVANYVPQTKAGEVKFDESETFTTDAWFHPTDGGSTQRFMEAETIKWQSTTNTWAADRAYFWPKTGDISFYSYAGSPVPTTVTDGTAVYTDKTIAITDNAVLASAARHYGASDASLNTYSLQYGSSNTDVTGVPTLFHHILAKVSVIVKFSAEGITDTKNKWDLVVNSASIEYANQGTLTVNFADGAKGQYWPFPADATHPELNYNWVPKSGAANKIQAAPAGTKAVAFDGTANKQTVPATAAGDAISDGIIILDEITVMPQVLATSAAKFRINYTLTSYYNDVQHIEETVNLYEAGEGTDPLGAIALTAFSNNTIPNWNMNYKYTYTVTIKPNKTVTFDPAVEAWATDSAGYTYPNN